MLAYIDYPGDRKIVTNLTELISEFKLFPGALASAIIMIGGVEVNEDYFKVWASITGSRRIIEDTYGEIWSYIKGVSGSSDIISLIMRVYEESSDLIDVIALSNALKLFLGFNMYDLGLAVIYENPMAVLNRERVELRRGKTLLTKRHLMGDLSLNTALILQGESSSKIVDWGNPGVLPASNVVGDESVSDPAYTALAFDIGLVSNPSLSKLTLMAPQLPPGSCMGQVVLLPLTLTNSMITKLINELKNQGFTATAAGISIVDVIKCMRHDL
ncbi:hypothetical protein [Caldivirga sp. UBA161]|uniref:hypothetical protein n=1 Tax=Caldivirga sp. UBA161 TaxID=1915569 RepID=UPI0025BF0CD5|nr:hypothetical protein [Caldivirga sp. UBA161]